MQPNTQPNTDTDTEQFFPGEEPFSRKKRERQRLVALYMTLIVCAALLVAGVTVRYTVLAGAYKPAPYVPPTTVASAVSEETETEEPAVKDEDTESSGTDSDLPTNLRTTYFSDAPGSSTLPSPSPSPSPTPRSSLTLLPDAVPTPRIGVEESVVVGGVVQPLEVAPISSDARPTMRLFEMPKRLPPDPVKLPSSTLGSARTTSPKSTQDAGNAGGLKVNITQPTITTIPGATTPGAGSPPANPDFPSSNVGGGSSSPSPPAPGSPSTP